MIIFNEQSVLIQWFPQLSHGLVIGFNRLGQILLIVAGIMALYQEQIVVTLPKWLRVFAYHIRKYAAEFGWRWTESDWGVTFPPETAIPYEELKKTNVFGEVIFSITLLTLLIWYFGKSPFEWILLPFSFVWKEFSTLSLATLDIWTLIKAIFVLISFFPMLFFVVLALLVVIQPIAYLFTRTANRISDGSYRLSIAFVFICGSALVLKTFARQPIDFSVYFC